MKITNRALAIAALFAILGTPSNAQQNYVPSGGSTYTPNTWIDASKVGVDCTGASDSTKAIQAVFTANPNTHLEFPNGCVANISSTITITNGVGSTIESQTFAGQGGGVSPEFVWTGTPGSSCVPSTTAKCKYMFDFEATDHPTVKNINFHSTGSGECPDGFLKFDEGSSPPVVGTNGRVIGNNFENSNCTNANFIGVYISPTSQANEENYIVHDNVLSCSGLQAVQRAHDGVINVTSTPSTLTSATAAFTSTDTGKRIRVSAGNPLGYVDTTMTYVSSTQVTLATAFASQGSGSQTGLTIITGGSVGTGIEIGQSPNSIQHVIDHFEYTGCAIGINLNGGNAQINQISGGYSDIGVYINNHQAQATAINFMADEEDVVGIWEQHGNTSPVTIMNGRFPIYNMNASGWLIISGGTPTNLIGNGFVGSPPATNAVLVGPDPTPGGNQFSTNGAAIVSMGNWYLGLPWAASPGTSTGVGFSPVYNQPYPISMGDQTASSGVAAGFGQYTQFLGGIIMTKEAVDTSAPAANGGTGTVRLQVVCGTNSGTAKIQVIGGTSTTPQTLLDNIGAGVSGC